MNEDEENIEHKI